MTLKDELPRLFDELADHHVVGSPPSLSAGGSLVAEPAQRRSPSFAWVAAAACLLLMVGGLVALAQRDSAPATSDAAPTSTSTPTVANPSPTRVGADGATILAPPADSEIRLVSVWDWDRSGIASVPDAPVGLLVTGESNPVPFDRDGEQWWSVDIVTTPGMTSVIGETNLGAFVITSDLSVAELVDIIDGLTPTPVSQLPAPEAPTDTAVPDQMTDITPTDTAAPGTSTRRETAPSAGGQEQRLLHLRNDLRSHRLMAGLAHGMADADDRPPRVAPIGVGRPR